MLSIPFFDYKLIDNKTDNLNIIINNLKKLDVSLEIKEPVNHMNQYPTYCNIIENNNKLRIYYRKFDKNEISRQGHDNEETWIADSDDMVHFKNERRIFKKFCLSHNFFVLDKTVENKKIGIGGACICFSKNPDNYVRGLHLYKSDDGIKWDVTRPNKILDDKNLVKQFHLSFFDTLNQLIYDEYNKEYKLYVRYNERCHVRRVQMGTSKDLKKWSKFKLCKHNYSDTTLYTPGVCKYPNSFLFLSFPTCQNTSQYNLSYSSLFLSYDGITFNNISKILIKNNMGPHRAIPYIYKTNDNKYFRIFIEYISGSVIAYNIRRDGFTSIKTTIKDVEESMVLKPLKINNNKIALNFKTYDNGYIKLILFDNQNNIIDETSNLKGDDTNYNIRFSKLSCDYKNNIIFKIIMKNCDLYSIYLNIDYDNIKKYFI